MQERRARRTLIESQKPGDGPPRLQVALRQLRALSWKEHGAGVKVHTETTTVYLTEDALRRMEIHQGNPEEICDILHQERRPRKTPKKRPRSTKPENRGKTSR